LTSARAAADGRTKKVKGEPRTSREARELREGQELCYHYERAAGVAYERATRPGQDLSPGKPAIKRRG
jgi:hypothetical protein